MKQWRVGSPSHQKEMDKLDKSTSKGRQRLSRLCFLVILTTTFSTLVRHFHYSSVSRAVVIKPLSNPSPSASETRQINPITRNKPLSSPSPSTPDTRQINPVAHDRPKNYPFARALATADNKSDPCGGRYIYIHDIPSRFNADMIRDCGKLSEWTNMCKYTSHGGFGVQLSNDEDVFSETGWYASEQYALDIIFHDRVKRYECLTNDSSLAAAVFVPFYAGFDVLRHLWGYNVSTRDATALDLVNLLTARPEWRVMHGRDHFFIAGRTTWDFRRQGEADADWGNTLLILPAVKNMTVLVVEASPWHANDIAVPFPTYFHPVKDDDVFVWQERMRTLERKWLFSFAGAPRPENAKSIRTQLIDQCKESSLCVLMECGTGPSKCYSPASIMKAFQSSMFCLQPQGDSFTRRSAFDAMLAGCIPVFFHPGTAYVQYIWHLPKNYTTYSVYIPEDDIRRNVSIEERLRKIPPDVLVKMRETVISLIPRLIYADRRSKLETIKDAFDVTVEAIVKKVTKLRRDIVEGRPEDKSFNEMFSWKYPLLEEGQRVEDPHEWDSLFS